MKLLLLLAISFSHQLFPAEKATQVDIKVPENITEDQKNFFNKNPDFIPLYNSCKEKKESNISVCMYEAAKEKGYTENLQYEDKNNTKKDTKLETQPFLTRAINEKNPVILKLQDFLYKQMAKEFFSEDGKKDVSQTHFFTLYNSQLSKDIFLAFSDFCMNYDVQVPTVCNVSDPQEAAKQVTLDPIVTGEKWQNCFKMIPSICIDGCLHGDAKDDAKTKACQITNFVKQARNKIAGNQKIIDKFNKSKVVKSNFAAEYSQKLGHTTYQNKKGTDVLAYGSEDAGKVIADANSTKSTFFKENCSDDENFQKNLEKCNEILNQKSSDEIKVELTEYGIKAELFIDELSDDNNIKKKLENHLAKEGRTQEEITNLTENDEAIEATRNAVIAKFSEEKKTLIEKLNTEIENADTNTTAKVFDEEKSTNETKALIKFNNIVSGLLGTTSETNEDSEKNVVESRNISVLNAEINQSSFTEEQKNEMNELEKVLVKQGIDLAEKTKEGTATLETKILNDKMFNLNSKRSPAEENDN